MSAKIISDETDGAALKIIAELRLKNNQQISEDDLVTVVKTLYPEDYQEKLEALLNSRYMKAIYIVDLK